METGETMAHQRVTSRGSKVVHFSQGQDGASVVQGPVPLQILQFHAFISCPAGRGWSTSDSRAAGGKAAQPCSLVLPSQAACTQGPR